MHHRALLVLVRYSSSNGFSEVTQDADEPTQQEIWGSARAAGFNMCFCDGSVHMMSYTINAVVDNNLGNHNDGQVINGQF
jgi:prepilin-type processing-associated H-X9-DG protein